MQALALVVVAAVVGVVVGTVVEVVVVIVVDIVKLEVVTDILVAVLLIVVDDCEPVLSVLVADSVLVPALELLVLLPISVVVKEDAAVDEELSAKHIGSGKRRHIASMQIKFSRITFRSISSQVDKFVNFTNSLRFCLKYYSTVCFL